jgi:hypothetical protein
VAPKFLNGIDVNSQRILAVASPSASTDAVNKAYVDDNLAGLRWKAPVVAATTANGTLASAYANGATLDGVTLATGDRILLKDQTAPAENGIYVVAASGAPTRATDADSTAELNAATVFVLGGTVNADKAFTQTATVTTVGTTGQTWVQFGGGATYSADGQGIELSSTTFSLELDGTSLSKSGSGLRIGSAAAAAGLTESSGLLSVGAGTGITVNANDVAVDTSVVARKYSASIGDGSTTAIAVTHSLGTKDCIVQLRQNSDDAVVYADVVMTSTTVCTVTFATAPATNAIRVTVIG